MPINQLSGAIQLSPEWSLRGQYFLEWRPNRLPEGGTYFGAADMLFSGPDRLFAGCPPAPFFVPRGPAVEPDRKGTNNFGLNLRYNPEKMSDTTFGVYYRKFDETQPWAPVFSLAPPSPSRATTTSRTPKTPRWSRAACRRPWGRCRSAAS